MHKYVIHFSKVFPLVFENNFRITFEIQMSDGRKASEVKSRTDHVLKRVDTVLKCPPLNSTQPALKESL